MRRTLGKRCVALDLKTDEGKEALWKFIDGADVFMEGFRPGTIQRYGFGYDAVKARNPGIIYYSISGFGQTGPMAGRPAMDPVLQAFNGIVTENRGEMDNHPHRIAITRAGRVEVYQKIVDSGTDIATAIEHQGITAYARKQQQAPPANAQA